MCVCVLPMYVIPQSSHIQVVSLWAWGKFLGFVVEEKIILLQDDGHNTIQYWGCIQSLNGTIESCGKFVELQQTKELWDVASFTTEDSSQVWKGTSVSSWKFVELQWKKEVANCKMQQNFEMGWKWWEKILEL